MNMKVQGSRRGKWTSLKDAGVGTGMGTETETETRSLRVRMRSMKHVLFGFGGWIQTRYESYWTVTLTRMNVKRKYYSCRQF